MIGCSNTLNSTFRSNCFWQLLYTIHWVQWRLALPHIYHMCHQLFTYVTTLSEFCFIQAKCLHTWSSFHVTTGLNYIKLLDTMADFIGFPKLKILEAKFSYFLSRIEKGSFTIFLRWKCSRKSLWLSNTCVCNLPLLFKAFIAVHWHTLYSLRKKTIISGFTLDDDLVRGCPTLTGTWAFGPCTTTSCHFVNDIHGLKAVAAARAFSPRSTTTLLVCSSQVV